MQQVQQRPQKVAVDHAVVSATTRSLGSRLVRSVHAACASGAIVGLALAAASGCALVRVDTVIVVPVQPSPVPTPPPIFKVEKITRYEKSTIRWVLVNNDGKEATLDLEFPDLLIAEATSACFSAMVHYNPPSLQHLQDVRLITLKAPMTTDVGPGMCVLETKLGSSQVLGIQANGEKPFPYKVKLNGAEVDPVIIVRDK